MDSIEQGRRRAEIRRLNDEFRASMSGGILALTLGVQAAPNIAEVLECVKKFDAFTDDNDPYGEHDFGAFAIRGVRFFFKIDYYARNLEAGSEDPADEDKTIRVLTVMLASEY